MHANRRGDHTPGMPGKRPARIVPAAPGHFFWPLVRGQVSRLDPPSRNRGSALRQRSSRVRARTGAATPKQRVGGDRLGEFALSSGLREERHAISIGAGRDEPQTCPSEFDARGGRCAALNYASASRISRSVQSEWFAGLLAGVSPGRRLRSCRCASRVARLPRRSGVPRNDVPDQTAHAFAG